MRNDINGIWISDSKFLSFAEMQKDDLINQIATRANSAQSWMSMISILPDPSIILQKAGNSHETYKKMENDPHIFAEIEKRKALTLSLDINFKRGNSSEKYSKLVEDYLLSNDHELFDDLKKDKAEDEDADIYDLMDNGLDCIFNGYQPVEVVWDKVGSYYFPVQLVDRPREWFHFDNENRLRFKSKEAMIDGVLLPDRKFLLFRHKPTYNNPYGTKVADKCFWAWMFKHTTEKWKIQFLEKFAAVWAIGKLARGRENPEYDNLFNSLLALINSGVAVIPDDGSVEIIDPAGKGTTSKIFDDNISLYNNEISKAVLTVTSLTGAEQKGSYASDQVRERMVKALALKDRRIPEKKITQLLGWIFDINGFGIAPAAELLEEEDYDKERADRDQVLKGHGVKFTKEYFIKHYNFDEEDIEVSEPADSSGLPFSKSPVPSLQFAEAEADPLKKLLNSIPAGALQKAIEPVMKPFIKILKDESISFADKMEKIVGILPGIKTDEVEELIAKANFITYLNGAADAQSK